MARVRIEDNELVINMQGARKLWTFRSELAIPLENVTGATADAENWRDLKFSERLTRVGTDTGSYFAGSFTQDGDRVFFDLKKAEEAVVIMTKDEKFKRIIIGVENPVETVELIENALNSNLGYQ